MTINATTLWNDLTAIRSATPIVHNITNYVVMNSTANALLAVGASPIMAHAPEEMEDIVAISNAVVINIGTLSEPWVQSMEQAMKAAARQGKPIIFDPVGVGATHYRSRVAQKLLSAARPAVVRGNASEIRALAREDIQARGVDSTAESWTAQNAGHVIAKAFNCTVCASGQVDYVIGSTGTVEIANGDPLMTKVTGLGCTATAIIGAFAAVNSDYYQATAHAMALLGIAGELAASQGTGPGSLQLAIIDALHSVRLSDIESLLKCVER